MLIEESAKNNFIRMLPTLCFAKDGKPEEYFIKCLGWNIFHPKILRAPTFYESNFQVYSVLK